MLQSSLLDTLSTERKEKNRTEQKKKTGTQEPVINFDFDPNQELSFKLTVRHMLYRLGFVFEWKWDKM